MKLEWIKDPDFLWQTEDHWPQQTLYEDEVDPRSPDVGKIKANVTAVEERRDMLSRFDRFSSWQRLKTAIPLCMKYKQRLKMTIVKADKKPALNETLQLKRWCQGDDGRIETGTILVNGLERAETEITTLLRMRLKRTSRF